MADLPPVEKIIERAYFHVGNGGLTLSILEVAPGGGGTPNEYRFEHEISVFGQKSTSSFPLGSSDIVSWMNMALQRVSMKVAATSHDGRSFVPFDTPPDVTHVNGEEVQKLASLMRIVARYQRRAYEFPSPEALHDYLHEHPQADKSKHTVKQHEEHHGGPKKSLKERLESLSDKAKTFVKNAPSDFKKFVDDEAHRRKVVHAMHAVVEKLPKSVLENAKKAVKHEIHEFKTASEGIHAVLKGEKMTDKQKKAVKTVAFDVALTVATAAVTGGAAGLGLGGFAAKVGESFVKALAKKLALRTVTHGLGHVSTAEELSHFGHGLLEHLVHLAGEEGDDKETDLVVAYITKLVADELKDIDPDVIAEALEEASSDEEKA